MKLNTIFSFFAPKDVKFMPMLQEAASILDKAAVLLQQLFSSKEANGRKELCVLIKAEETKGDKVTGRIFKELNDAFITPFDREDISALADSIDDAIDAINRSAQKVLLYSPEKLPEATRLLADIIKQTTTEVLCAADELFNIKLQNKQIRAHTKEIKRLEERADVIYEEGIMNLFKSEANAIELFKTKEIIQELEKSVNRINQIGKVLKTIIVKYA
jgi:Phosphate transport regulator (distant homolog of PhoU)